MTACWQEVSPGIRVWRTDTLDLSLGLIEGTRSCLVIDTGIDSQQGFDFASAIRSVTSLPWQIVYTHDHFDHWFGTEAFGEAKIWASGSVDAFLEAGRRQRETMASQYRLEGKADQARRIGSTRLTPPNCELTGPTAVDLGGRTVVLRPVGKAHTDNDVVVEVPDDRVLFAGDLFENGADPAFEDAYPQRWAAVSEYLLSWKPDVVVPGHGEPADYWWARRQMRDLGELAALCREVATGYVSRDEAVRHGPFNAETMSTALDRDRTERLSTPASSVAAEPQSPHEAVPPSPQASTVVNLGWVPIVDARDDSDGEET